MPQRGPGSQPVGIVFDSDLGNQPDGVLALALLYGLDGKGECRVVATTVSKPNLKSAALSEIIDPLEITVVPNVRHLRDRVVQRCRITLERAAQNLPMFFFG